MVHRNASANRKVANFALATLLATVCVTLSQCTQVGDQLTGVSLSHSKPVSCKHQCQNDFNVLQKQEQGLHNANMKACGSDAACKQAENGRHAAAMKQLTAQMQACKANCHKQGAGSAG